MIHTADADFTLYCGDVLDVLPALEAESAQTVVTSPPYWNLRDYGTGEWEGGDALCDHAKPMTNMNRGFNERWGQGAGDRKQETKSAGQYADACLKCGAVRVDRQLGLEPTPEQYVERMVGVFREVRRVLRNDGTVWLNLGDSYASVPGSQRQGGGEMADRSIVKARDQVRDSKAASGMGAPRRPPAAAGIKAKDLVGIPWMVAFALRADGWHLRMDVVWWKLNAMPESVKDRPTKSHEYVFLLSKSPRYFWDDEAASEPAEWARWGDQTNAKHEGSESAASWIGSKPKADLSPRDRRNIRSVWPISTQPYSGAHFATFPEALVERCITATCPEGGVVLDPFMGSGTTALVARRLGRRSIGIELNRGYCDDYIAERTRQLSLFA